MSFDSLQVTVHAREGIVFSGHADAISGKNAKGPFDVLPMHANFVTTLFESITVHSKSENFSRKLDRGLLWARGGNTIDIYIGIGGEG
jgi:F0F1-type ATP synthase epsilon subunit